MRSFFFFFAMVLLCSGSGQVNAQKAKRLIKVDFGIYSSDNSKNSYRQRLLTYDAQDRLLDDISVKTNATSLNIDQNTDYRYTYIYNDQADGTSLSKVSFGTKTSLQDTPWVLINEENRKYDNKDRILEAVTGNRKMIVTYDDDANSVETINMEDGMLKTKVETTNYLQKVGIRRQDITYEYINGNWVPKSKGQQEFTLDGNEIVTNYDYVNNQWKGRTRLGKLCDDAGRLVYSLEGYWNDESKSWHDVEKAWAYDDMGRLIMEQDGNTKLVYEGFSYWDLGEETILNTKEYHKTGLNGVWVLASEVNFEVDSYGILSSGTLTKYSNGDSQAITILKRAHETDGEITLVLDYMEDIYNPIGIQKIIVKLDDNHRMTSATSYYNIKAEDSNLPAEWVFDGRDEYTYNSDGSVEILTIYNNESADPTSKKVYTLYPNGQKHTETQYLKNGSGNWYLGTYAKTYLPNGEVECYLIGPSGFNSFLPNYEGFGLPVISYETLNKITRIKSTKESLDKNGDGKFDNENGTYIYFEINGEWRLQFANERKINSLGLEFYKIEAFGKEMFGYDRSIEINQEYDETGLLLASSRKWIAPAEGQNQTDYRDYSYEEFIPVGVKTSDAEDSSLLVISGGKNLIMTSSVQALIYIYSIDGSLVKTCTIGEGETSMSFTTGLYVVRCPELNVSTKVLIRN